MALAIRMARGGRKNLAFYRIVVADSRAPRDGRYIEKVGTYNPLLNNDNENRVVLVKERIQYWLDQGAKPSDRVALFLAKEGMIEKPKYNETPKKSAQSEKTKMRIQEKEEKRGKAAEAAKQAAEDAKAAKEAAAAAPAEEPAPAAEAEAPAAEAEAPAAEEAKAE